MSEVTVPYFPVDGSNYKRRWIKPAPGPGLELRFDGTPDKLVWFNPETGAELPVEDFEGALP